MSAATDAAEGHPLFDPYAHPELYQGLRFRRSMAFIMDLILITVLMFATSIAVLFLGVLTLGLAWMLFAILWPAVALLYVAFTLGGANSATPGMRAMGIELRLWYGDKCYPLLAAVHGTLFYLSVSFLTPLVLLVSFFSDRKRLLHDMVLGTVMVDSAALRSLELDARSPRSL
ncbi:RDD family protein [Amorphus sp. 3PC139-8]|uniref:RDD family protein n=1 Tax=Amorphus sp. 3PC139-8 TaxID=2735676 RepID=UPI00345DDF0D